MLDRPAVAFIEAARGEAAFQVIETDVESDDAEDGELSSSSQRLLADRSLSVDEECSIHDVPLRALRWMINAMVFTMRQRA